MYHVDSYMYAEIFPCEGHQVQSKPDGSCCILASEHYKPSIDFCHTFPKLVLHGATGSATGVCFHSCSIGISPTFSSYAFFLHLLLTCTRAQHLRTSMFCKSVLGMSTKCLYMLSVIRKSERDRIM